MDKEIPRDIEIERFVTGSFLIEDDSIIEKYASLLREEDFTDKVCKNVIAASRQLLREGKHVDMIMISRIYPGHEQEMAEMMNEIVTTANLEGYINQLKEITARRESMIVCLNMAESISHSGTPIDDINNHQIECMRIIDNAESLKSIDNIKKSEGVLIEDGISTGFLTWDANDSGLKDGRFDLLIGPRGHGKTTISRQVNIAVAKQGIGVFNFCGETSIKEEKTNLSRLCALEGEMQKRDNLGGRTLYYPTKAAFDRFNEHYAKYIHLCDASICKNQENLFNTIFRQMKQLAKNNVKVFIIDSMMKINNAPGNKRFTEQKMIVQTLKDFAVEYQVHVILIVHPSKHHQGTSGVAEQENLADSIFRYSRIFEDKDIDKIFPSSNLPEEEKKNISAILLTEKIRDQGATSTMFLEFDSVRGAVVEINQTMKAREYEANKMWVRSVHRISDNEVPDDSQKPYKEG